MGKVMSDLLREVLVPAAPTEFRNGFIVSVLPQVMDAGMSPEGRVDVGQRSMAETRLDLSGGGDCKGI